MTGTTVASPFHLDKIVYCPPRECFKCCVKMSCGLKLVSLRNRRKWIYCEPGCKGFCNAQKRQTQLDSQLNAESYSVIKSNCHKQYLSNEPKNCKKWPNPMIFRKLLCGGFGILMSQNYQTEKMLHFTGVLKWQDGSTFIQLLIYDAPDKQP